FRRTRCARRQPRNSKIHLRLELAGDASDLPARVVERAVSVHDEVRASDLLFGRPLRGETLTGRVLTQSPRFQPRNLEICRTGGHDHAIESLFRAGLEQQRHVDDREPMRASKLEGADARGNRAVDRWMHDRFELAPRRWIGKHDWTELRAIDGTVGGEALGPEPRANRSGRLGSRRFDTVRELIGIETRHAEMAESIQDVALPRRNAAGERDLQHG